MMWRPSRDCALGLRYLLGKDSWLSLPDWLTARISTMPQMSRHHLAPVWPCVLLTM